MPSPKLNRRGVLLGASAAATLAAFKAAHGIEPVAADAMAARSPSGAAKRPYYRERAMEGVLSRPNIHEGKGVVDVRFFFHPDMFAEPAILLTYSLPPGASEGVHTHNVGDRRMGSFDEFYYILSGRGEMQIAGEKVPVRAGDHIFTPNGIPHGIGNTSAAERLEVYLIAMKR